MKKLIILIKLILIGLFIVPICNAKLSPDFVDCLATRILEDCGNDIGIHSEIFDELRMKEGEQFLTKSMLKKVIELIDQKKVSSTKGIIIYGEKTSFIDCGDKKLQYFGEYYWDGIPVYNFCPKINQTIKHNYFKQELNIGKIEVTQNWFFNFITNFYVSITITITLAFSITLNICFLYKFIFKKRKNKPRAP